MVRHRTVAAVAIVALVFVLGRLSSAQGETLKARLSPVPVENATLASITGSGSATAVLNGSTLTVRGSFEGMQTPATLAQIHLGPKGVRGPVMFDLTVTKESTSGTIAGTLTLTPEQVEAVKRGRFYVQIHSVKAPDGNLWGWLLP
jgi:hypothetical protein